jgi:acyl-CoA synthetase (AMP-forming)/AMP-acid ligase II
MGNRTPRGTIGGPVFTSVSEQVDIHARFRPHDLAFIEGERRLTWAEYNARANLLAATLRTRGVNRGDRVALLVPNCTWAHEALLATWRCGAVAVPLSPMLQPAQLNVMLDDAGCAVLLAGPEYAAAAEQAAGTIPVLTEELLADEGGTAATFQPAWPDRDELAVIIYSSGTTGVPKGIAHSHESRLSFATTFATQFRFHEKARALSCVPPHSNGAWLSWLPAKWTGATTVVLPSFSADAFLDAVRAHAPTHGFLVPTMASALLHHPGLHQVGLQCFETLITAGSPMPEHHKRAVQSLSAGALYELWGLTEGVATIIGPADMDRRTHSVGRPMLGCDIRIIDADDRDVTHGGCGEIVGRSGGMMDGYWNRPDADAAASWHDDSGRLYLRTGDLGEFDADGYLILRGRKKDMILSGGLNVYPVDIEARLLTLPGVREAVVFGVEDDHWGEVPVALVHADPMAGRDVASLMTEANAGLARHQRIKDLMLWPTTFPRNSMGKISKVELRAEYLSARRTAQ